MNQRSTTHRYDHSSHPEFLAYYSEESVSAQTRARFARVQEKVLRILPARRDGGQALRVLDIGCGAGAQAWLWTALGHQVFGLDVNAELIGVARARAAVDGIDAQFDVGSATALPYADSSMDVCLMPELLEHVDDWQACLREAIRVLKSGGVIYLSTTNVLCPRQSEFNLPCYSWYPGFLKRRFERLSVTTRPDLANFARYPAVHWFTCGGLRRHLDTLGATCMDRFDVYDTAGKRWHVKAMVWAARHLLPVRLIAEILTEGTNVFGIKRSAA